MSVALPDDNCLCGHMLASHGDGGQCQICDCTCFFSMEAHDRSRRPDEFLDEGQDKPAEKKPGV